MLGIGRKPLETVDDELAQGSDVFVFGGEHADLLRFFEQLRRAGDGEVRRVVIFNLAGTQAVSERQHLDDLPLDGIRVEVCVGDGHKQAREHLAVERVELLYVELVVDHDGRNPLERIEQHIHAL